MIRVALLSFWHFHAESFVSDALKSSTVELVAAWDEDPERGAKRAAEAGIEFVPQLEELLARPDIDGVIVQTPTSMHVDIIDKCAKAGKHVLTDKVLAPTWSEAKTLVDTFDAAGLVLVTSLVLLDHDYVQQMKAIVASGELGRIVNLRILAGHGLTLLNMMPEGFFTRSEAVGGVLMDICHPLYITTYLLGEPETVYARFAHVTNRELEDSASVLMDFADGAHVSVDVSFVMKGAPSMQIEVIGTEGSVFYRGGAEPASKGPSTGTVFEKRMDYPNRITNLVLGECPGPTVGAWAEHVATGTRADSNIGYSLGLSLITEAAYQSATTRLPVSVSTLRD